MRSVGMVLAIAAFSVLIGASLVFSQDVIPGAAAGAEAEIDLSGTAWILGEVISVDTQKNEIQVRYLDYETEQDKEITLGVDNNTTYENVKSLSEVKPKDTVSVDYVAGADGKNIVKALSVEAPEAIAPEGEIEPPAPAPMGTGLPTE